MNAYLPFLSKCPLFFDIKKEDLLFVLSCLDASVLSYEKNEFVLNAADTPKMGVVLTGGVHIVKEDFWGERSVLGSAGEGDLFGEAFCYSGIDLLPVSVVTVKKTEILFINAKKLSHPCKKQCPCHLRLIQNMLRVLAEKNVSLTKKAEHMSKKTTRAKLLSFLSAQAQKTGKNHFYIPFDRQQLADYLSVDRSAMSAELSKMQKDGQIVYTKNEFTLLTPLK